MFCSFRTSIDLTLKIMQTKNNSTKILLSKLLLLINNPAIIRLLNCVYLRKQKTEQKIEQKTLQCDDNRGDKWKVSKWKVFLMITNKIHFILKENQFILQRFIGSKNKKKSITNEFIFPKILKQQNKKRL